MVRIESPEVILRVFGDSQCAEPRLKNHPMLRGITMMCFFSLSASVLARLPRNPDCAGGPIFG